MSFQTALSGLNSTSRSLDVIGNNIANSNTVGMKSSRVEFSSLMSAKMGTVGSPGTGVSVSTAQNFTQGNVIATGNDLDMAINGTGFFQVTNMDGTTSYTRDGQFKLDKYDNIVTNTGAKVMGFPTDIKGNATSTTFQALTLPTSAPIAAKQTTSIGIELNLDARAPLAAGSLLVPAVAAIAAVAADPTAVPPVVGVTAVAATPAIAAVAPTPRTTYATSINAFDSQGVAIPVSLYFEHVASSTTGTSAADNWDVYTNASGGSKLLTMSFDGSGNLVSPSVGTITTLPIATPSTTTPAINATLDLSKVTQFGNSFSVTNLTQDGYVSGVVVGVKVGSDGNISARYSNGQTQVAGKIYLAEFRNPQGLAPMGANTWIETSESGAPLTGAPGMGKFGTLASGSLEESNVDLTFELVNMMTAQRAYQANAQTIKTQDQIMTTLVNLR
jgi:flagellar hook protein FlgE